MVKRCGWCENTYPEYIRYHDEEWGVPAHDDQTQFEFLLLEGAQAGLSWSTILNKRAGYRKAFENFVVEKVASFDEKKIQSLLNNPEIVRNQLKIRTAVTNAQKFIEVQQEFGSFDQYIWRFVKDKPLINQWKTLSDIPATTRESDALSKDSGLLSKAPYSWKKLNRIILALPWALEAPKRTDLKIPARNVV